MCSAVNRNMGIAGFLSTDHKKKLLWGSKKAEVEQVVCQPQQIQGRYEQIHIMVFNVLEGVEWVSITCVMLTVISVTMVQTS